MTGQEKEADNSVDIEVLSVHEEKTPVVTNKNSPNFEIHVADKNISSGAITISWCFSRETLDCLKDAPDPCVVIVTSPPPNSDGDYDNRKEKRKVVRIKDLFAYVDFSSFGTNRIYAFIQDNYKVAKSDWLTEYNKTYNLCVYNYTGSNSLQTSYISDLLTVNVPQELFGKPPSQWEQDWVYWLDPRNKAVDQCDFRSKRLFAYTMQLPIFIVALIVRFVIVFWAILWLNRGFRDLFRCLIHPLKTSQSSMTDFYWKTSLFTYEKSVLSNTQTDDNGDEVQFYEKIKQYRYNWFTPGGLLVLSGIFLAVKFIIILNWHLLAIILGVSAMSGLIIFGGHCIINLFYADRIVPITQSDIDLLVCSENKIKSIKDVKNKSIRLQYDDLKNKVCKPYSM